MQTIQTFVAQKVPTYVQGSVLDVGGGRGRWKPSLAGYAKEYFISDLFAENADFTDDARKLSNPDNSFDTVVCFEALEHIDDTRAVVGELYRVLKPGGFCVVSTPFLYQQHGNPHDYYRFTPAGLVFLFSKAGFVVVESGTIGNLWSVIGSMCKSLHKNHAKKKHTLRALWWHAVHSLFSRLQPLFSAPGGDFFTNAYVIARKS